MVQGNYAGPVVSSGRSSSRCFYNLQKDHPQTRIRIPKAEFLLHGGIQPLNLWKWKLQAPIQLLKVSHCMLNFLDDFAMNEIGIR